MDMNYERIPKEKFAFAQLNANIHDKKLDTKARGFFADAMIRFRKNKSSVIAAYIIGFLVLFAIIAPLVSPYTVQDKDTTYTNYPPFIESIADLGIGIFDGSTVYDSLNDLQLANLYAIGTETGMNPVIKELSDIEKVSIYRGQERVTVYHRARINRYYAKGIVYRTINYEEFQAIQEWQNETGIQVLYPFVEKTGIYYEKDKETGEYVPMAAKDLANVSENAQIWYRCSDTKGTPILDANGNRIAAYSTNVAKAGPIEYNSIRVEGDDGSYIYSWGKSGSLQVRICYYNYYQFLNGKVPTYVFGTDEMGRDLFCAIGMGARFSLVFAIIVSAINLTIGAIYGAIQGYYGGAVDLAMDRVADILSGVPFIVVATLFQLHLAQKVGPIVSFLFAFVMTGWIGMAALTRKQFYRFKSQEYILAAKTLGASDWRLMFKHIFPNALGTIITSCVLVIPGVISSETSLTYLGIINLSSFVGTSIGELMSMGQVAMETAPHAMLFPSMFISLLLISFNLFGNGLRDAFNPSTRGVED